VEVDSRRNPGKVIVNKLTVMLIWVAVIGVIFAIAWSQGLIARLSVFVQETREELNKCSWPTWDELKGSTVLVMVAMVLLGLFTFAADLVFSTVSNFVSSIG